MKINEPTPYLIQNIKETIHKTNFKGAKMVCRVEHTRQRLLREKQNTINNMNRRDYIEELHQRRKYVIEIKIEEQIKDKYQKTI